MRIAVVLFYLLLPVFAGAQLVQTIPCSARFITVDDLGNVYLVHNNNTLTRYNSDGDSSAFFGRVLNGDIGAVDASNPLRVLVYYPQYSRIVVLDRMLSQKADIDLRRLQLYNAPAIAGSADGNIWVYDPFNARLHKINEQQEEVSVSNDLRQSAGFAPNATFMTERDRKLYLCDSARGILVFDQFATYINTIPITGLTGLQVFGEQIVYQAIDSLTAYNAHNFSEKKISIPMPASYGSDIRLLQCMMSRGRLYVLHFDRLDIWKIPE